MPATKTTNRSRKIQQQVVTEAREERPEMTATATATKNTQTTKNGKTLADVLGVRIPNVAPIFYRWSRETPWTYGNDVKAGLDALLTSLQELKATLTERERIEYRWGLKKHALREAGDERFLMSSTRRDLDERASKAGITLDQLLASYGKANEEPAPKSAPKTKEPKAEVAKPAEVTKPAEVAA
jgi:hypothetical protein